MPQSDTGAAAGASAAGTSSDMQSKIQAAFQQDPALANVTVNASGNTVELSGTAASKKDRKKAVKLARENANGAKVVDNIQVGGGSNSTTPQH